MILTIGKKLGLSFGIILILMTISSVVTYLLIMKNEKIQNKIVNTRMKTVLLGKDVTNGINQSLAGLRGYLILSNEPTKSKAMQEARNAAWTSIDSSISEYDLIAKNWTVPANITRLKSIKSELQAFRVAQQEIEDISQTDNNIESYHVLLTEAAPKASKMLTNITTIINEEGKLEASTSRKALLKNLADIRGSFAISLANIRAFLLSGDKSFIGNFEKKWNINQQSVDIIIKNKIHLFTSNQKESWNEFISLRNQFESLPNKMFTLRNQDDWNKANYWLGTKAAPKAQKILSLLNEMKSSQEKLLINDIAKANTLIKTVEYTLIILTLISLIIGIFCSILFSRDLLSRLDNILIRSKRIADGDMTGEPLLIKGQDELSDLTSTINQMSTSLLTLVSKTANSIVDASEGTKKILVANNEMVSDVNKQTMQISQITAAVEELSYSSTEVANNCVNASDSSMAALELAKSGGEIVQNTLSQMIMIEDAFKNGSTAVENLSHKSKDIDDILDVIKGIADQTNLLALNAAIEAARAGEQGRGFAVVSDEVRQLAKRTTDATTEVEIAIESMRTETKNAMSMMDRGSIKVQEGVDMTNHSATSLNDIITSVDDVVEKIQSIAATAEQQSMTTAEVAKSTENVSCVSSKVEAGIEDVVQLTNMVVKDTEEKSKELLSMI